VLASPVTCANCVLVPPDIFAVIPQHSALLQHALMHPLFLQRLVFFGGNVGFMVSFSGWTPYLSFRRLISRAVDLVLNWRWGGSVFFISFLSHPLIQTFRNVGCLDRKVKLSEALLLSTVQSPNSRFRTLLRSVAQRNTQARVQTCRALLSY